jgi:hypothetical protein
MDEGLTLQNESQPARLMLRSLMHKRTTKGRRALAASLLQLGVPPGGPDRSFGLSRIDL